MCKIGTSVKVVSCLSMTISGMCDVTMVMQYLYGWYGKGGKCDNDR